MGQYNSFVVKIWTNEATAKFRGHIQHVGSQDATYFITMEKMVEFIKSHLGPHPGYSDKGRKDYFRASQADDEKG
ncbi:MAG: hypothetical protein A2Y58_06145 [Chloroflexi bacterium RBG_13_51_52]|nr:MAG: hypothetical protein A2Y58_06145 [Chloroflexi bacterium RBG_13_51_52]